MRDNKSAPNHGLYFNQVSYVSRMAFSYSPIEWDDNLLRIILRIIYLNYNTSAYLSAYVNVNSGKLFYSNCQIRVHPYYATVYAMKLQSWIVTNERAVVDFYEMMQICMEFVRNDLQTIKNCKLVRNVIVYLNSVYLKDIHFCQRMLATHTLFCTKSDNNEHVRLFLLARNGL